MFNAHRLGNVILAGPQRCFLAIAQFAGVKVPLLIAFFLLSTALAGGLPLPQDQIAHGADDEIDAGIVVGKVAPHSEGEKAGIREGDILLSWSRGDSKGEIQSPFDLPEIEIEQAPWGTVKLAGLRETEKQVWSLGQGPWGLTARPNFVGRLLSEYREGEKLAQNGNSNDGVLQAAERWKKLATRYSSSQIPWLAAWLYLHAGVALEKAKQRTEADDAFQAAVQHGSGTGPVIESQLLQDWARAYWQRNDLITAKKYLEQAVEKRKNTDSGKLTVANWLNILGGISSHLGDLGKAEQYYHQALELQEKSAPGSLAIARTFNQLGILGDIRGDKEQAEKYYHLALEIQQRLSPNDLGVAEVLTNLGALADSQGDFKRADKYYHQAIDIYGKVPPSLNTAIILNNLGSNARKQGDLAEAELYCHKALEIQEKLAPESLDSTGSLNNLGIIADERGELTKAEDYYRRAFQIIKKLAPKGSDAEQILVNLGTVAFQRGDLSEAEQYYHQALDVQVKLAPKSFSIAHIIFGLGDVASARENLSEAEQYYHQALAMAAKLMPGTLDMAAILDNLGYVAFQQGNLIQSERYYRQALAIQQQLAPESLDGAVTMHALGQLEYESGNWSKAEKFFRRALIIREKLAPGSKEYAGVLAALGSTLQNQKQMDAAVQFYAQAVNVLERQTANLGGTEEIRSGFRAKYSDIYRGYVDLLLAQQHPEKAFEVLERSRARILLEMLTAAHIDIHKGADSSLLEQERSLRESLAAKSDRRLRLLGDKKNEKQVAVFTQEIEELEKQYQEVEGRLRANSPAYAALTQLQPLTASEIQQLLDADSVLLEYSLGEKRSYVFAVMPSSVNVYELPKQAVIESAAKRLYRLLSARNTLVLGETRAQRQMRLRQSQAGYAESVQRLGQMLLSPVAEQIKGKRLLIVGDGALQYIPFAVLPSPRLNTGPRKPLIAEHEIVNLPSASILSVLRREASRRKPAAKGIMVLADPVFGLNDDRLRGPLQAVNLAAGPSLAAHEFSLDRSARETGISRNGVFPRLPFSRREAESIYATAKPGDVTEALDFDASKATAMSHELGDYRIVHLATHGLVNSEHPELSGLVFSLFDKKGQSQDGFLRLTDIYNLNLNADLVVLSACQTALGKQINGEGLIGITRGFMYAGSARVVASLWKVDDEATAELMKKFYEGILKDGQTPAEALRAAQMWMRNQNRWKAPYYWAGFILMGEWK